MNNTAATTDQRIKCPKVSCKFMARVPATMEVRYNAAVLAGTFDYQKHTCGTVLAVVTIIGKTSETECGDKCKSAIGPACECKCSGDNHGVGR
jgi:hypothetical protein